MHTVPLDRLAERLDAGHSLTDDEAGQLASTSDIVALGVLADRVRRRRHGTTVTYVRVADVPLADALNGEASWPAASREIRLTGRPESFDEARAAVRAVSVAAGSIPLTAFTLADLESLALRGRAELQRQLALLRDEGLTFVAEAVVADLADAAGSLAAATEAHLAVACLTVESPSGQGPLALIDGVRTALSAAPGTVAFAPLPRRHGPEPTTGYEDVKAVALSRILLRVEHIQVDWKAHGPKLAQVALTFGADDVYNVSPDDEGSEGRRRSPREEILRNIRAAGLDPAERDGRFRLLD